MITNLILSINANERFLYNEFAVRKSYLHLSIDFSATNILMSRKIISRDYSDSRYSSNSDDSGNRDTGSTSKKGHHVNEKKHSQVTPRKKIKENNSLLSDNIVTLGTEHELKYRKHSPVDKKNREPAKYEPRERDSRVLSHSPQRSESSFHSPPKKGAKEQVISLKNKVKGLKAEHRNLLDYKKKELKSLSEKQAKCRALEEKSNEIKEMIEQESAKSSENNDKIDELKEKIAAAKQKRKKGEEKLRKTVGTLENKLLGVEQNVDNFNMKFKEKEQEYKLSLSRIKELKESKRQAPKSRMGIVSPTRKHK